MVHAKVHIVHHAYPHDIWVSDRSARGKNTRCGVYTGSRLHSVVIGLGVSSLLWYWLFSYNFGLINRLLVDLGIASAPIIWFGEDANQRFGRSLFRSCGRCVGFGMLLFVSAIQAIPRSYRSRDG